MQITSVLVVAVKHRRAASAAGTPTLYFKAALYYFTLLLLIPFIVYHCICVTLMYITMAGYKPFTTKRVKGATMRLPSNLLFSSRKFDSVCLKQSPQVLAVSHGPRNSRFLSFFSTQFFCRVRAFVPSLLLWFLLLLFSPKIYCLYFL